MMQKYTKIIALFALLIFTAVSVSAATVPVTIDRVEIDDITVTQNQSNRLDLQRGQEVEVEVEISASQDTDDVEIEAFISGFEYNDIESIRDVTHVFDMDVNVTYVKRLRVRLSDDIEEDDYKLRVIVSNRNDEALIETYNLKLDVPRHGLRLEDVVFFPGSPVKAGQAVLATVRLENKGEKDEDDVRVMISIPELGVSAVDYIDEIEKSEEEETEEMFLRIPPEAKSGTYDVDVSVEFNQRHQRLTAKRSISIVGDPNYKAPGSSSGSTGSTSGPDAVVTFGTQLQSVNAGEAALFPLTIKNNMDTDRAFTVTADGAGDWAAVKVTPSTTQIVEEGDSKLFSVYLTPKEDVEPDAKVFSVTVKMGDRIIKQIPLTVNIMGTSSSSSASGASAKRVLEVLLIILVVLLIIVGLVIGFRRAFGSDDDELEEHTGSSQPQTQTYY